MNSLIFTDVTGMPGLGKDGGAYKVASFNRTLGIETQVIDYFSHMSIRDIQDIIDRFVYKDTSMVGFSTTHFSKMMPEIAPTYVKELSKREYYNKILKKFSLFPQSDEWIKEVFTMIKKKNPDTSIVVGGYKTYFQKDFPGVDSWVIGTIESNFSNSMYIWNPEDYITSEEFVPIEIGRGCLNNCPFCNYSKEREERNLTSLKHEFQRNYELYGIQRYMFLDPVMNNARKICELILSLGFPIEWTSFMRLDSFSKDPELRELVLKAGAKSIQFGIETTNVDTSRRIGKPYDPDVLYYLREKWEGKILTGSGFVVGLPGETERSIEKMFIEISEPSFPLDSINLSLLYIRHYRKGSGIDYSLYSQNPSKYGYEYSKGNIWNNGNLSSERAQEMLHSFSMSDRFRNKRKIGDYHFYARLRNLNYLNLTISR